MAFPDHARGAKRSLDASDHIGALRRDEVHFDFDTNAAQPVCHHGGELCLIEPMIGIARLAEGTIDARHRNEERQQFHHFGIVNAWWRGLLDLIIHFVAIPGRKAQA